MGFFSVIQKINMDNSQEIEFLHIPKTGGNAFKTFITNKCPTQVPFLYCPLFPW